MRKLAIQAFVMMVSSFVPQSQGIAQEAPDGWVPFQIDDDALHCGGYSKRAWAVTLDSGRVAINPTNPYRRSDEAMTLPFDIVTKEGEEHLIGDRHAKKVEDGWLVGFDAGEWGGALWWFSEDGNTRTKLADENVVGLTKTPAEILALTGLAHLGMDYGKVLRVKQDERGSWKADTLADLGAAPRTFVVESLESVLVITTKSLVRVKTTGTVEQLFQTRYQFLYPNSMTLSNGGAIHVGMRHFVTRLTPTGTSYREEWFVPKDCQRFELQGYDCVCVGGADQ